MARIDHVVRESIDTPTYMAFVIVDVRYYDHHVFIVKIASQMKNWRGGEDQVFMYHGIQ